jgi:adenylosuccinate synthase
MPGIAVIGAQWGDEGKGKITHMLAAKSDMVVRYSGGPNAGHTVIHEGTVFKLHQVPSGALYPHVRCLMGNGMVVDPTELISEMQLLRTSGIDLARLTLSGNAHLILPYHRALDKHQEHHRGDEAIGTTGRGIGPAYTDKVARRGVRAHDLLRPPDELAARLRPGLQAANALLATPIALDDVLAQATTWRESLGEFIGDAFTPLHEALEAGQNVLFEGAQGTLLDIDHGTYPYVTSSNPTTGGLLTGSGVGPRHVTQVLGVAKAFQTRVGGGPMPTELEGDEATRLRGTGSNPWDEFGTTTGRARRVGWLDAVALRYSVRVNGLTHLALTKLDILSGLQTIPVAVAYQRQGDALRDYPAQADDLSGITPSYENGPGWTEDISTARHWDDLPPGARNYVLFLEKQIGIPITIVSVGQAAEATIHRH